MILIDANLLLYAYHPRAEQHPRARAWLEKVFDGPESLYLAWTTVWAFLRISTHPNVFERPLSMAEAEQIVSTWLALPTVALLEPGERYWEVLTELFHQAQVTGPLVMDAALAALAVENGATLCTTDRDFTRFPKLKVHNPLVD